MIDINKQIEYWKTGAESDLETAEILINNNKLLHGLFFCHLTAEKLLKALVVKETKEIPPKTHNLIHLKALANIELAEEQTSFLSVLMEYLLEGRYPQYYPSIPSSDFSKEMLNKTKTLFLCLRQML